MQAADIDRMEAVDVLGRVDRIDHLPRIDLPWQGQLHQNAVDVIVMIEPVDFLKKIGFAHRCVKDELRSAESDLLRFARLAADVNLRGRVIAYADGDQTGAVGKRREHLEHLALHLLRDGFSVDDPRRHARLVPQKAHG